jgi:uncharacterized protein YjbI with pentapeptide repeats
MSYRRTLMAWTLLFAAALKCVVCRAEIYRWDTGALIPRTEGIVPGPGVQLGNQILEYADLSQSNLTDSSFEHSNLTSANITNANLTGAHFYHATLRNADLTGAVVTGTALGETTSRGFTKEQLYSTASYKTKNLQGILLYENDLTGWDFSGQNISNAYFWSSVWTGANLTDAIVTGAQFPYTTPLGFSREQLYSTASYQTKSMKGISLAGNDLTGWDFSGQYLADASLSEATLTGADLTGDTRGAFNWFGQWIDADYSAAFTTNMILPDGSIAGLVIGEGQRLVIRDDDGGRPMWWGPGVPIAISVLDTATIAEGGLLELVVEADAWDSVISFEPGIPVQLGGSLELTFAEEVNVALQLGHTLRIFDWTGVSPTGQFTIRSPYVWDVTNLYMTGEVKLIAVPEPNSASIILLGAMVIATRCRCTIRITTM